MDLNIESCFGNRNKEIIDLLADDGFMDSSEDPSISVIASVLNYQKVTNNFNKTHASLLLNSKEEIVGYLGHLAFPVLWQGKEIIAVQTTSAFIVKNYPGNFKRLLDDFVELNKNLPLFSILPTPKIHRSFERIGFVEVNKGRFSYNHYIITSYSGFLSEIFKWHGKARVLSVFDPLINLIIRKKPKKCSEFQANIVDNFNSDFSQVEIDYRKDHADLFVAAWNSGVLKNKFGNKLSNGANPLNRNEALHIVVIEKSGKVTGSIILKKVRGLNRLIISDIQTIKNRRVEIVNCLVEFSLATCRKYNFNALMFFGLDETYSEILKKGFCCFSREVNMKAYFKPQMEISPNRVSIVYSDDDVNF